MSDQSHHIILVHGTYAKNAAWTGADSAFRDSLAQFLNKDVKFAECKWSGRNLFSARQKGAATLAKTLRAGRDQPDVDKQILVGHSHGGSVIAYALKQYPDLKELVSGIIFISTPFVDARKRFGWGILYSLLAVLFLVPVWFYLVAQLHNLLHTDVDVIKWPILLIGLLGLVAIFWLAFPGRATGALKIDKAISEISTSDVDHDKVLVVKSTGDEALGILGMVHMISWLTSRLIFVAIKPIGFLLKTKLRALLTFAFALALSFYSLFIWVALRDPVTFQGMYGILEKHYSNEEILTLTPTQLMDPLALVYPITEHTIAFLPMYLPYLVKYFMIGVGIVYIVSLVSNLVFGRLTLLLSLFVEISVETSPRGEVAVYRQEWSANKNVRGLSHSQAYQDKQAILHMANWIDRHC